MNHPAKPRIRIVLNKPTESGRGAAVVNADSKTMIRPSEISPTPLKKDKTSAVPVATVIQGRCAASVPPTPATKAEETATASKNPPSSRCDWRQSSSESLAPLASFTVSKLQEDRLQFPINEECTSLKVAPSGKHIVAGFTDGTLRIFDLTGTWNQLDSPRNKSEQEESFSHKTQQVTYQDKEEVHSDYEDEEEEEATFAEELRHPNTTATSATSTTTPKSVVCSKSFQRYGAVAAQIQARGVHTSLQMHVDISQDGLWCFGGVVRGSVELVAVNLTHLELQDESSQTHQNVLDCVQVERHNHAKLKGFGACTRLQTISPINKPKYLLLTGKGIKNIHIWSFSPHSPDKERWQCLYDTPTNGNTISLLHLRYDPHGQLQALSKSEDQKLRLWDLSYEQHDTSESNTPKDDTKLKPLCHSVFSRWSKSPPSSDGGRPKRPPYVDVASTESTLGICGSFCFGGGHGMYNQVSVVGLDVKPPYNVTEMALPGAGGIARGRQQRGDLKSITQVAGMVMDAGHVLLELSDGSVVHYWQTSNNIPQLEILDAEMWGLSTQNHPVDDPACSPRTLSVTRVASAGTVVAAMATYRMGRGSIVVRQINTPESPTGFWGWDGAAEWRNNKMKANKRSPKVADKSAIAACVNPISTSTKPAKAPSVTAAEEPINPAGVRLFEGTTPQPQTARVSLSTDALSGKAVSPEGGVPPSVAKRAEEQATKKKNSALMKYLTTETAGKKKKKKKKVAKEDVLTTTTPKVDSAAVANKKRKATLPSIPRKRPALKQIQVETKTSTNEDSGDIEKSSILARLRRSDLSPMRQTRAMRKETGEDAIISAHYGRTRPPLLTEVLPKSTVIDRCGKIPMVLQANLLANQEAARMKLAMQHRAQHEMLRKRVLANADASIRLLTRGRTNEAEARKQHAHAAREYHHMLDDMLARQRMEASSLAAEQSCERDGAPELQVSFPFPEVFAVASRSLETFIKSVCEE